MLTHEKLTHERLKELLHYDPETGAFTWLVDRRRSGKGQVMAKAGSIAGVKIKSGYLDILIDGRRYKAHRLAYFYMTGEEPEPEIDHVDLNRANNRWDNLRMATREQNMSNKLVRADSTTGVKGVQRHGKRFTAEIKSGGERYYLGIFDSIGEAALSYALAARELHGEFGNPMDFEEILNLDWLPPMEMAECVGGTS